MDSSTKKFRDQRIAAGMSQEALAAACGVTQGLVSCWEAGKYRPSVKDLMRVCEVLGCTPEDLGFRLEGKVTAVPVDLESSDQGR